MKKFYFLATALVALASCTNDEFVGEDTSQLTSKDTSNAIVFKSGANTLTRADHVGADAAGLLHNKFIVGGFKGAGDVTATVVATGTVFDNYNVNWKTNSAGTTESNTSDWEYVGYNAAAPSGIAGNAQSIKYWDYSAAQYDFIAYSTGDATVTTEGTVAAAISDGKIKVTKINPATAKTAAYTLAGGRDDLAKCYIADMVTAYKDETDASHKYQQEVPFVFRSLASKVRIAIYETVPGYSVKDVKFYTNSSITLASGGDKDKDHATLFTTGSGDGDYFYTGGTYTVSFPTVGKSNFNKSDYNKAHVAFAVDGSGRGTTQDFGALQLVGKEYREKEATDYIGRSSSAASYAGASTPFYTTVLPNETGAVLELRVDYTLLSIDGSGEEIHVHGATAFVPAIYAAWKPNYAYTYIFKISDNTNGWTSTATTDPAGLYPITFDAVVSETTEHTQATITTVSTPSITTYQKGHDVIKDEYSAANGDIYVQVMQDGTLKADLNSKGQLYTLSAAKTEAEVMDALNIRVATTTTTITGRNGLVLTQATSDASITTIPGADGNNITVTAKTAAKFTPAAGTYAYVYDATPSPEPAASYIYSAVTLTSESAPSDWTGNYWDNPDGTGSAVTTYVKDKTYYRRYTNNNKVYAVKVIKVIA